MIAVLTCVAATVLVFGRRDELKLPAIAPGSANGLVNLRGSMSLSIAGQSAPSHQPIPDAGEPIDWGAIERERVVPQPSTVRSMPVTRGPREENVGTGAATPTQVRVPRPEGAARGTRPARYHRIVEGDTLRDLANRYLGSPDRYLELFYANRSVLPHPDVLPLNARIVIPERADPLAPVLNSGDAAEARAASPWSSRRLPAEGMRLPKVESP